MESKNIIRLLMLVSLALLSTQSEAASSTEEGCHFTVKDINGGRFEIRGIRSFPELKDVIASKANEDSKMRALNHGNVINGDLIKVVYAGKVMPEDSFANIPDGGIIMYAVSSSATSALRGASERRTEESRATSVVASRFGHGGAGEASSAEGLTLTVRYPVLQDRQIGDSSSMVRYSSADVTLYGIHTFEELQTAIISKLNENVALRRAQNLGEAFSVSQIKLAYKAKLVNPAVFATIANHSLIGIGMFPPKEEVRAPLRSTSSRRLSRIASSDDPIIIAEDTIDPR